MRRRITDEARERRRLLSLLAEERAQLEWPCQNPVLLQLVDEGLVARTRDYEMSWGGRDHKMTSLEITPAGRAAIKA